MFIAAVEKLLPSPSVTISSFLKVSLKESDRSISVKGDPRTDPETKEILSEAFPPEDFLILLQDNEVIGVIDTWINEPVSTRKYALKGLNMTISQLQAAPTTYPYGFDEYSANKLEYIASLYMLKGNSDAAEIYYRKVLDMIKSKFGSDHPYVIKSLIFLAEVYYSRNDLDRATNVCAQAWNIAAKNIDRWLEQRKMIFDEEKARLTTIIEILRKLSDMLKKVGLESNSQDVFPKIDLIKSAMKEQEDRNREYRSMEDFVSCTTGPASPAYSTEASPYPSVELHRYPYVKFPSTLRIGENAKLIINITAQPSPTSINPLKIIASKLQHFVPIVVSVVFVEPNILELIGDDNAVIHVPVKGANSKPVEFSVRAKKEGYQTILLQFYNPQQQMYVGELVLKIHIVATETVVEDDIKYESKDIDFLPTDLSYQTSPSLTADLILEIRENKRDGQYRFDFFFLSSNIKSEYYPRKYIASLPLKREPEEEIRAIIEDIEQLIRYPLDLEESLSNKGYNLYENLFPKEVKEKYWKIKDKIKSIHIFSNEPWIPWEILKPWKGTDGGEYFLCQEYAFTRWPTRQFNNKNYYRPNTQQFQIEKAEVIVSSDTRLTDALKESEWIRLFGEGQGFSVRVRNTVDDVHNILDSGNFDLLHISAHGKYDPKFPDLSHISIEEGRIDFRAESIVGPKIVRTFSQSSPIVFLNACQSGSQGYSLTGIGGWAQHFINVGASAFIGTLWSVTDAEARQFTEDLYSQLCKPRKLSEAVQKTRNSSRNPGDVSRMAYVLFAPPDLSVSFNCKKD